MNPLEENSVQQDAECQVYAHCVVTGKILGKGKFSIKCSMSM